MEQYTRVIGSASTNISTPSAGQITQGNDTLTPYDSAKNNGYYNEISQAAANASEEIVNVIVAAGLTPDGTLAQLNEAIGILVAGTPVELFAYLSSDQNIGNATTTKVQLDSEDFDVGGHFDNSTNYRYTPPAGRYCIAYGVSGVDSGAAPYSVAALLYKNGSSFQEAIRNYADNGDDTISNSILMDFNGTDYIELFSRVAGTGATNINGGRFTYLSAFRIS